MCLTLVRLTVVSPTRFRHVDPKIVPHTGASVLPVERHTHAPGAMRETRGSVSVAGQARTYIELSPIAVKPGVPLPLVLVLHGAGGSADSFHNGTFFERATGDEAIVVYPDGLRSTWPSRSACSMRSAL